MKIIVQILSLKGDFAKLYPPLYSNSPHDFLRYADIYVDMIWFGVDRFECLSYTELKIAYEFSNQSLSASFVLLSGKVS